MMAMIMVLESMFVIDTSWKMVVWEFSLLPWCSLWESFRHDPVHMSECLISNTPYGQNYVETRQDGGTFGYLLALLIASTFLVHCRFTIIPEDFMTLQSHVDFVHVWAKVTEQTACKLKGRHLLYFFFPLLSRPSTPNPSLLLTTQNLSFHLSRARVHPVSHRVKRKKPPARSRL